LLHEQLSQRPLLAAGSACAAYRRLPLQLLGLLGRALGALAAEGSNAPAPGGPEAEMLRRLAGGLLPATLAASSGLRRAEVLHVLEGCAAAQLAPAFVHMHPAAWL
jgi:hypothetical protein